MAEAGNIKIVFSAETTQLKQAFSTIKKEVSNIEKQFKAFEDVGKTLTKSVTLPLLALGGAAFAAAAKLSYTADRILDLNQITGLSTKAIQEWQHVARIAGVELETVTNAIEGLVRRLPQLEDEGGRAAEQLSKLGLTFKDIKTIAPDKLVDTIMDRLAAMENILERNAVGSALFGRAWEDIAPVLGLGANAIKEARQEAHDLGLVLDNEALQGANNFRIELEKLKAQLNITFLQFGQAAMPVLQSLMNAIRDILPVIQSLINAFASLPQWLQNSVVTMLGFVASIGPLILGLTTIIKSFMQFKAILVGIQKVLPMIVAGLKAMMAALSGISAIALGVGAAIGAVVISLIAGTIQANKLRQEFEDLHKIMRTSTDDAEKFAAAWRLWQESRSSEGLEEASKILEKYNLNIIEVGQKAEEMGVTFEEAATMLIRQAQAEKQAKEQAEELKKALSGLTTAAKKNIQAFDEVNQVQEEGEDVSIVGDLDSDLEDVNKVTDKTTTKLEKLGKAVKGVGDESEETSDELKHLEGNIKGIQRPADDTKDRFEDLDSTTYNLAERFGGLSLKSTDISDKLNNVGSILDGVKRKFEDINTTTEVSFGNFRMLDSSTGDLATSLKTLSTTTSSVETDFSGIEEAVENVSLGFTLMSTTAESAVTTLESNIQTPLDNIEGFLSDVELKTEDVSDAFWDSEKEVDTATDDIEYHTDEMKDNVIGDFQETYDKVVGNSIVPDLKEDILKVFDSLKKELQSPLTIIEDSIVGTFSGAADDVINALTGKNGLTNVVDTSMGDISNNVKEGAKEISDSITGEGGPISALEKFKDEILDVEERARDFKRFFEKLGEDIADVFKQIADGSITTGEAMKAIWELVKNSAKQYLFDQLGKILGNSLAQVAQWASGVLAEVATVIAGWLTEFYAALVAFFAWMGPAAPAAAAAVLAGVVIGTTMLIGTIASQIAGAIGLAQGGIVTGPTLTMLGEGGKKEAVVPLERDNVIAASVGEAVYSAMLTAMKVQAATTSTSGIESEQKIVLEIDGNTFARLILPKLQAEADRQGLQLLMQEGM